MLQLDFFIAVNASNERWSVLRNVYIAGMLDGLVNAIDSCRFRCNSRVYFNATPCGFIVPFSRLKQCRLTNIPCSLSFNYLMSFYVQDRRNCLLAFRQLPILFSFWNPAAMAKSQAWLDFNLLKTRGAIQKSSSFQVGTKLTWDLLVCIKPKDYMFDTKSRDIYHFLLK